MAKINPYQQNQLASSLVGTPGVDRSGATLAQNIENIAATQAGTALSAERQFQGQANQTTAIADAQANLTRNQGVAQVDGAIQDASGLLALRMAQNARNEKAQQAAQDAIDTATESSNVNTGIGAAESDVKTEYNNNPKGAPEEFTKRAKQGLSDYLDGSSMAPEVKAAVYKSALERITSKSDALNNWKYDRGLAIADQNIKGAADTLLQSVESHPLNGEVFNQSLRDLDSMAPAYELRYGGDAGKELNKAKSAITEAYASPMARNNPMELMQKIDQGEFAGKMPQEKIDSFYGKAIAQVNTNRIKAEGAAQVDHEGRSAYITSVEADVQGKLQDDPQQQLDTWNELDALRQQHQEFIRDNPTDPSLKYRGEELKQILTVQALIDTKMKEANVAASQLEREQTADQKAATESAAKHAKEQALAVYQGQDGKRAELAATFALFSADSKVRGTSEELQQTIKARAQIQELLSSHGLIAPGERSSLPGHYLALIQERLKRIATAAGDPANQSAPGETPSATIKSVAEQQLEFMTRPAPQSLQDALNPHGHGETSDYIRRTWADNHQSAVDQLNQAAGRPEGSLPSVGELIGLQKILTQKMLTTPQLVPAGTSKYGVKGQDYKFVPPPPDLTGEPGVPTEGSPAPGSGKGFVKAPPATVPSAAGGPPGVIPKAEKPPTLETPMMAVPKPTAPSPNKTVVLSNSAKITLPPSAPAKVLPPLVNDSPAWKAYDARMTKQAQEGAAAAHDLGLADQNLIAPPVKKHVAGTSGPVPAPTGRKLTQAELEQQAIEHGNNPFLKAYLKGKK